MVRKISFLILSVAILVTGVVAFSKLGYWERSVRIFSFSSNAPFNERMGGGPGARGEIGERGRSDRRERPGGGFDRRETRELPDSLRQQFRQRNGERMGRGTFEGRMRNGEGRGRGEFQGGKKINILSVKWFLAVFASFTVIVIYIDKAFCLIRMRKVRKENR
jgi:hypothetical protein